VPVMCPLGALSKYSNERKTLQTHVLYGFALAPPAGLEPTTYGLEVRRSIH
jgi:hypothetical protein